MRMCINSIGWGDLLVPSQLCEILQDLQLAYKTYCSTAGGEMGRKMQTLKQSVSKVRAQSNSNFSSMFLIDLTRERVFPRLCKR